MRARGCSAKKVKVDGPKEEKMGRRGVTVRTKKHSKSSQTIKMPSLALRGRREEVKKMHAFKAALS